MGNARRTYKACYALYIFVNLLFIVKYSLRASLWLCLTASCAYLAFMLFLPWGRKRKAPKQVPAKAVVAVFVAYMAVLLAAQCAIDPYSIKVDRWSAINNFLACLFQGQYPYMARTHLGGYGSPFPVWQVLHIPFYLLHNVGLSFFAALAAFAYFAGKYTSRPATVTTLALIMLSPAFMYEALARSDLMANFLVAATIVLIFYNDRIRPQSHFLLTAVTCGLILSTRLSAVLPLGMLVFADWWRLKPARKILFPVAVLLVFAATFLPFVFWDGDSLFFFKYNPFALQAGHTHPADVALFIILFVWLALEWPKAAADKLASLMAATAMLLFIMVVVAIAHNMVAWGNYDLFSSAFDITYFDMSLPFLILATAIGSGSQQPTDKGTPRQNG